VKATRVLNDRMDAAVGADENNDAVTTGDLIISPDGVTGPGLVDLLRVYGDLFDVHEVLSESGIASLAWRHERDVEAGREALPSALVMYGIQCMAHGVLQERLRWERGS
jgi:hypothetical protein